MSARAREARDAHTGASSEHGRVSHVTRANKGIKRMSVCPQAVGVRCAPRRVHTARTRSRSTHQGESGTKTYRERGVGGAVRLGCPEGAVCCGVSKTGKCDR